MSQESSARYLGNRIARLRRAYPSAARCESASPAYWWAIQLSFSRSSPWNFPPRSCQSPAVPLDWRRSRLYRRAFTLRHSRRAIQMNHEATSAEPQPAAKPHWQFGFWSLIVTQFQNAFNDNAIKYLVIYLIIAMNFAKERRDFLGTVVSALFALPFIFFSLTGGYFADRYSKRSVVIGTKLMEIFVMGVTIVGLWLHNLPLECAAVFLISTQSALFGPSKYGLLPEVLPERRLSWGNGVIELGTFIGSISAVTAAGYLAERYHGREAMAGVILLGCTLLGLATSFGITHVPAANPTKKFRWNPFADLGAQLKIIRADRVLGWAVLGNTYLWFLAALLQFTILV